MKVRLRNKDRMQYAPRHRGDAPYRATGMFYENYCCKDCFWHWGTGFGGRPLHKHDCGESNYNGALKKYWKTSSINYFEEFENDTINSTPTET